MSITRTGLCINGEPRPSILATKSFNALSSRDQSTVKIKTASWLCSAGATSTVQS